MKKKIIPVFDLKRQHKVISLEILKEIGQVLASGNFILGEKVRLFEKRFAGIFQSKFAVGVASGTDAITLSLRAMEIGRGDEVIIPANAYPTAFAVAASGALIRLCDIDEGTYNIDVNDLASRITKKTKAIVAVHLYGYPADLPAIKKLVSGRNIKIIEDCAQAHGAGFIIGKNEKGKVGSKDRVQMAGSMGDAGCFSFYPTKNLGAYGDGGMVVTGNEGIARQVRLLRMYGEKSRYESIVPGVNSRLDELQAAILLVKLKYLKKWLQRRREIAKVYKRELAKIPEIILPIEEMERKHAYHLFVIRTKKRDSLMEYLKKRGIGTAVHYPVPIHLVKSFSYLGYERGDFPNTEKVSGEILSLPMFPEFTDREVDYACDKVRRFYQA